MADNMNPERPTPSLDTQRNILRTALEQSSTLPKNQVDSLNSLPLAKDQIKPVFTPTNPEELQNSAFAKLDSLPAQAQKIEEQVVEVLASKSLAVKANYLAERTLRKKGASAKELASAAKYSRLVGYAVDHGVKIEDIQAETQKFFAQEKKREATNKVDNILAVANQINEVGVKGKDIHTLMSLKANLEAMRYDPQLIASGVVFEVNIKITEALSRINSMISALSDQNLIDKDNEDEELVDTAKSVSDQDLAA